MTLYGDELDPMNPATWNYPVIAFMIGATSAVISAISVGILVCVAGKRELERVLHTPVTIE